MSALRKGPKGFQLGGDRAALEAQQSRIQNRMDKLGPNAPGKYAKRLGKVQSALAGMPPDVSTQPVGSPDVQVGIGDINQGSLDLINQGFEQAGNVWKNNPLDQDYSAMRQQATDTAMNEFDRLNAGAYKQQDDQFQQEMAQRGIQVGSDAYEQAYQRRITDPRANARQGAMNNAFQMGQGEQQQMFNQAGFKAQLPFQQLSYMSPFYQAQMQAQQQQGQQGFLAGQNELDRQNALALQKMQGKQQLQAIRATPRGGGGGGGLSYDQQLGLIDREFYNNAVLNGMGGYPGGYPQQSTGNQFVQGLGAGIGMGFGSGLR